MHERGPWFQPISKHTRFNAYVDRWGFFGMKAEVSCVVVWEGQIFHGGLFMHLRKLHKNKYMVLL